MKFVVDWLDHDINSGAILDKVYNDKIANSALKHSHDVVDEARSVCDDLRIRKIAFERIDDRMVGLIVETYDELSDVRIEELRSIVIDGLEKWYNEPLVNDFDYEMDVCYSPVYIIN